MQVQAPNCAKVGKVGIIHPGPPATCGGVMASELTRHLNSWAKAEEVFVERRRKCRIIDWRMRPDRVIEHWTKHFAFFQINARLPRYDVYHFLSERHARLLRYGRTPAVVTIHDTAPLRTNGVYTEGTRNRFRKNTEMLLSSQAIVTNTENAKSDIVELFGVKEDVIKVICPGVNHGIYMPRDMKMIRELLGLPLDARIILNVGNENKNNNMTGLLEVVSRVRSRLKNVILLRIGPVNPSFDEAIRQAGASEWVVRTGAGEGVTDQYNYYFNAADIYLCMDYYTGYSIQGLSSMASGCPVVSSNRGGFTETAGGCARMVDVEDASGAAEAIVELLEDEESRKSLAGRGYERSLEYKWEEAARSYLTVYEGVLKGS